MGEKGIGASILRKEDGRFLAGKGNYVSDIALPNMVNMAFYRSPVAHGRIVKIEKPEGAEDRVFVADDLRGLTPMRAPSKLPGYKPSDYPALATGKVRFVGEPVAGAARAGVDERVVHEDGRFPSAAERKRLLRHGGHRQKQCQQRRNPEAPPDAIGVRWVPTEVHP